MRSKIIQTVGATALTLMVFSAGYICGTMGGGTAEAQLGGLGSEAMKQAGGGASGLGAAGLGSVGEMGTALVEMEQHVSGLQKNLDALKKVKAALGG